MPGVLTSWAVWGCLGNMFSHGYSFKKSEIWFISFPWFYGHRFITAIHVLLFFLGAHGPLFFFLLETFDPIWRYVLRGSFGRLKASSIYGFGWVGAVPQPLDESSKLQKRVVFLCFCQQKIDRNHLKFWVSQVRVLYNISDFLLKPPPKQGNNNMGSVTIFYFFPPCWFSEDVFFFLPAQKVEVFGGSSSMAWAVGASSPVWRLVEAQKCRRWWLTVRRER